MKINKLPAMGWGCGGWGGGERGVVESCLVNVEGTCAATPSVARGAGKCCMVWQPSPGQRTVRADVPLRYHATPVVGVQAVLGRWAQQVVCNAIIWEHGFSKGGGAKGPSSCHSGAGGRGAERKL